MTSQDQPTCNDCRKQLDREPGDWDSAEFDVSKSDKPVHSFFLCDDCLLNRLAGAEIVIDGIPCIVRSEKERTDHERKS
jgi:hypothetical protein